jgi:hypothetical protein
VVFSGIPPFCTFGSSTNEPPGNDTTPDSCEFGATSFHGPVLQSLSQAFGHRRTGPAMPPLDQQHEEKHDESRNQSDDRAFQLIGIFHDLSRVAGYDSLSSAASGNTHTPDGARQARERTS